ncbi:MAG: FtsQ-type POTRA domain-containing protein [Treponema sp.]|jgi:cell division protein FtsQ|nr:FtsQ-type POTRA domain-containing protein [Treponema sp.]
MMAELYFKNIMPDASGMSDAPGAATPKPKRESRDPGSHELEQSGNQSSVKRKIFKWFFFLGLLALVVELIWFLGVTPFRPLSGIEVIGLSYYDKDSLLAYIGITPQTSYIFSNTREMENLLSVLPRIESAKVHKRFPNRLEIIIQNRRASAMALANFEGRTVPVIFDRRGVIFQIGSDYSDEPVSHLPVISGLIIESPFLGMSLPARLISFLEDLEAIRNNAPELLHVISEIRIDRRSSEGFDLTLYLHHNKIKVRLSGLNEELLRYTLLVTDVLAAREPGIDLIDFRGGVASYYPKGGIL